MARVTEEQVKEIIDTALTNEEVAPVLALANTLVTDLLTNEGYSDTMLAAIEQLLGAHFVAIRDPQIVEENHGDAKTKYGGKTDTGFGYTSFGQQAMVMEYKGILKAASLSKGAATMTTLDYDDGS